MTNETKFLCALPIFAAKINANCSIRIKACFATNGLNLVICSVCLFISAAESVQHTIMTSVMLLADVSDDVIQLMAKDSTGKWRHLVKANVVQQREFVEFQLDEQVQRLSLFVCFYQVLPVGIFD